MWVSGARASEHVLTTNLSQMLGLSWVISQFSQMRVRTQITYKIKTHHLIKGISWLFKDLGNYKLTRSHLIILYLIMFSILSMLIILWLFWGVQNCTVQPVNQTIFPYFWLRQNITDLFVTTVNRNSVS